MTIFLSSPFSMQKITYLHFLIPEHRNPPQCFFFLQIYHPSTLQLTSSWVAISLFPPTKALAYLPIPNILPAPLCLFSHHLPSASFTAHPSTDMDTALLLSVTQRGGRPSSPPPTSVSYRTSSTLSSLLSPSGFDTRPSNLNTPLLPPSIEGRDGHISLATLPPYLYFSVCLTPHSTPPRCHLVLFPPSCRHQPTQQAHVRRGLYF